MSSLARRRTRYGAKRHARVRRLSASLPSEPQFTRFPLGFYFPTFFPRGCALPWVTTLLSPSPSCHRFLPVRDPRRSSSFSAGGRTRRATGGAVFGDRAARTLRVSARFPQPLAPTVLFPDTALVLAYMLCPFPSAFVGPLRCGSDLVAANLSCRCFDAGQREKTCRKRNGDHGTRGLTSSFLHVSAAIRDSIGASLRRIDVPPLAVHVSTRLALDSAQSRS